MKLVSNVKAVIGRADRMIYGHFLEHFHRQIYGGVYDPTSRFADQDGFREDVIEALKRIRTPIIRWPGGCFVSSYHWKEGIGKNRQPTFNKAWRVEESNAFGTDEFIQFCHKVGCEPYICTNAGTGSVEEMSDWVEYCNLNDAGRWAKKRIENGFQQPHGVKYWSIGNENWGGHEIGEKDRTVWGRLAKEAAKEMLRVDPAIELSAASIPSIEWNVNLLSEAGKLLDWISVHKYWDRSPDGFQRGGYDQVILRTGSEISKIFEKVRAYLTAYELEGKIRIAFDEWNLRGWFHPYTMDNGKGQEYKEIDYLSYRDRNDNNSLYTMADAVFSAAFLNTCLRNCDIVGMACFSPAVNTVGAIFTHENGLVLRPTYYVFELYANLMKDNVLDSWKWDVETLSGMDQEKEKTVDTIDAVVTYGDGAFAVAAVNKDPEQDRLLELDMTDANVSRFNIHTLNGSSKNAYNDIGVSDVCVRESGWQAFRGKIELPPHSVSVIEIQ